MSDAPAGLFVSSRSSTRQDANTSSHVAVGLQVCHTVDVIVPDEYCALLLREHAEALYPVRVIHEAGWIVRLRPPIGGTDWVLELLALLERWLAVAPLPCVAVVYGGRRYLVRARIGLAGVGPAPPSRAPARRVAS